MTRVRRDLACVTAVLLLGGCGAQPFVADEYADDTPVSAPATVDPPSAIQAPVSSTPTPILPAVTSPPSESPDFASQVLDGPASPPFELAGTPDVISGLLDYLILDLVSPVGLGWLSDSYTYLERLCLEADEPDFVCRQRYGR